MEIESDDMELSEPIIAQSSISNIKYMEDPIEHEPMYIMETFSRFNYLGIRFRD